MKKSTLLIGCILLLALAATAQEQINFSNLPLVSTPTPLPSGYGGLNWTNMFYVDPSQYSGAGPGYVNFFTHRDVAFVGGQYCAPMRTGCYGIITSQGTSTGFQAVSAIMAAGYQGNQIRITAYRSGAFVGSITFPLGTTAHTVNFPAGWGVITELMIQTDSPGDLVLFDLSVYTTGG